EGTTMRKRRELADRNSVRLKSHLKQHRARLDLTQEELAERVGVRRQTILAIEKGHYAPSAVLALLLARELGMNVDDLFELETREEGK
ncbi:MAG TPA: helix-turn-helix transcriptional regulator, partial [bacterium]|nr:helix-turn-helix transcriptional regulator [bacterium]